MVAGPGKASVGNPHGELPAENDERRASRFELSLPANVVQSGLEVDLMIDNLSPSGLSGRLNSHLILPKVLDELQIHLSEGIVRRSTIVWTDKEAFGARFEQTLSSGEFASAKLLSSPRSQRIQAVEVDVKIEKQDHFAKLDAHADDRFLRSTRLRLLLLAAVCAWAILLLLVQMVSPLL
jgi:hypothetical protein